MWVIFPRIIASWALRSCAVGWNSARLRGEAKTLRGCKSSSLAIHSPPQGIPQRIPQALRQSFKARRLASRATLRPSPRPVPRGAGDIRLIAQVRSIVPLVFLFVCLASIGPCSTAFFCFSLPTLLKRRSPVGVDGRNAPNPADRSESNRSFASPPRRVFKAFARRLRQPRPATRETGARSVAWTPLDK